MTTDNKEILNAINDMKEANTQEHKDVLNALHEVKTQSASNATAIDYLRDGFEKLGDRVDNLSSTFFWVLVGGGGTAICGLLAFAVSVLMG